MATRDLILAATAALTVTGCAGTDLTRRDVALETTYQLVNYLDARGTANIAASPIHAEGAWLTRRIIGPQPSPADTYLYFATMGLSHYLIVRALPPKWRPWYQGATILYSGHAVRSLSEAGLLR